MKVRALWGFKGIHEELKNGTGQARAGEEFDVSEEYGHALVGKGLATQVDIKSSPTENKVVTAAEKKASAEKTAAEKQAAADKALAEKVAADKAEADRVAAEKAAADKAAAEAK